ncbi:MAG: hypothetical protein V1728_03080, partial [Candidatus Micrarchaeota archaeon]
MGLNYRFYSQQDGGGSPSSSLAGRKQFESGLVQVVEDFNKAYFAANPGIDPAKFWPMENKTGSDGVNRIRQLADAILGGGRQNVSQSLKDVGAKGTIAYPMGSTDTETIQYYSLLFERVGTWLSTWGIDTDKSNGRSAQTTRSQDGQTMYVWFGLVQSHALIASAISRNASQSHSTSTSIMSDAGGEKTTSAPGALSPKEKEDLLGQFETRLTYEIAVIVNSARDTKRVGETYTLRESSSNSDMIPFLRTSFVDRVLRTDFRVDPTVLSVSMNLDPGAPDTTVADYLLTANRNGGVLAGICDHYARFLGCTREELFTLTRTANAFGRITISLSLNVSREEMEGLIVTAMSKPALASDDAKTSQRARREKKIESESTQIGTSPQLQTQTTKTEKRTVDDNLARGETKKTTKTAASIQSLVEEQKTTAKNAPKDNPVPIIGDIFWASNAIQFAAYSLKDEKGVPLDAQVRQLSYLLNVPSCKWDETAKTQFMDYLVSMAYFVPEQYRKALFTPNLDHGQHTLLSSTRTWNSAEALDYMKSLYLVLSGDPAAEDQIPGDLLNASV